MKTLLPILSFLALGVSLAGLLYSVYKKKGLNVWLIALLLSLTVPFMIFVATTEKKVSKYDKYGQPIVVEPEIDAMGNVALEPGSYFAGEDFPLGVYDVKTPDKFADFSVFGSEPGKYMTQRIGLNDIDTVRVKFDEADEVRIMDPFIMTLLDDTVPVYEERTLYPGIWYVDEDLAPGAYILTPITETAGFVSLYDTIESTLVGETYVDPGKKNASLNFVLTQGDRLKVTDMNFVLKPVPE